MIAQLRQFAQRIAAHFRASQLDRDLDAEMSAHIDLATEQNLRDGLTPEEARRKALANFGGLQQTKENHREARKLPFLDSLSQDIRFGLRVLRKSPAFTAVAIFTLALGIGANTAIFSFVSGTLLRVFPYRDSDRLVLLWSSEPERGWTNNIVSEGDFVDWRNQSKSFEDIAGYINNSVNLSNGKDAIVINGLSATANFFSVLGMKPELGQPFRPGDDRPGAAKVVLLGHNLWARQFAADPQIVGKTIQLDQQAYTVLGVMPASFVIPTDADTAVDFWTPYEMDPAAAPRDPHALFVLGRLRKDLSIASAQQEMAVIGQRLAQQYPKQDAGWTVAVETLHQSMSGNVRAVLLILMGAVGCVLLIACVNVANLQLSRGVSRRREFAIRSALGGSRRRIVRQLLTESLLISLSAAALGVLLARWSVDLIHKIYLSSDPGFDAVSIDLRVLLLTLVLAVLTAFLFGLAPAWMTSKIHLDQALRESGRSSGASARTHHLRGILVAAECALAVILLVGAGLLIRTFNAVTRIDPGFDPHNVLAFQLSLSGQRYDDPAVRVTFFNQLFDKLNNMPGVEAASIVSRPPFLGYNGWGFVTEENPAPSPTESPDASYQVIGPEYFRSLHIPVLQGRAFTKADQHNTAPVVVINQSLADQFWPGQNALGKHLRFSFGDNPPWATVVGIVGNVRRLGLDREFPAEVFVPYTQYPWANVPRSVLVRATANPLLLAAAIRRTVSDIDPQQAIDSLMTMDQVIHLRSVNDRSFNMVLLGILAAIALLLSVVGIYSVMSYSVNQRVQEIGVRMALGARTDDVLWLVLRSGTQMAIVGLAIGLAAAFALSRLMSSLLFNVSTADPITFAAVAVLLALVALVACYIPARRATQVDPISALRYE